VSRLIRTILTVTFSFCIFFVLFERVNPIWGQETSTPNADKLTSTPQALSEEVTSEQASNFQTTVTNIEKDPGIWRYITQPDWLDVIIALVALIVGTFVALYIFRRERIVKSLSYKKVTSTPLFKVEDEFSSDITVQFKGETVDSLHITVLEFLNTGNTPIKPDDFVRPLCVGIRETGKILNASIVTTTPENLEVVFKTNTNELTFEPLLLNERDSFQVKIISTQSGNDVNINGRIVGISSINEVEKSTIDLPFITNVLFEALQLTLPTTGLLLETLVPKASTKRK
jgi:hypothetical protein